MSGPLLVSNLANKICLLIAEDSQGTRHNLLNLLSLEPDIAVVGTAGNGKQAIELAFQLRPDVILMDINLPEIDGITATTQIRSRLPATAVVIMSIQDEESYFRRATQAGAHSFLVKPFSGDELMHAIYSAARRPFPQ